MQRPWVVFVAALLLAAGAHACRSGGDGEDGGDGGDGSATAPLSMTDFVTGLGPTTDLAFLPDGRLVVTEKTGAVRLRALDGTLSEAGVFDVDTESEKGLLGVLVPPDFAERGRLLFYVSLADAAGGTDLDRNRVLSVPLGGDGRLDLAAAEPIVTGLRGPENHDGGGMVTGPDGKLYVGVGDTGCNSGRPPSATEAPENFFATCLSNGNGKILRVNFDGSIPGDNPLAEVAEATACGETCGDAIAAGVLAPPRRDIFAWGLRNPWRFAFDPETGLLWVGDLGEVSYEEITIVERGRHHGWPWREGPHGWPVETCRQVAPDAGDCVDPVYHCTRDAEPGIDGGCVSITGGAFFAAARWPEPWRSRYVFGDNVTGRLWTVDLTADRRGVVPGSRREIAALSGSPVSIRPGPDGDLYVAVLPGRVVRLSPP
jgi:glucose/arabinose dehydrogenase